ncbi:M23 family metallopeptidase [Actinacidiphila guanduensis]|uniref:Murein DD-endopeptidase MepM and murein hydrolase activator NlpD, contain LysM domain n=1 Tax=Actinacidiphila guanduensis TaxID=310781 RepID=A0A1H0M8E8_9ACTN|nr:M23 family metallopeptidase [Actinacidiphila guanduensis]SDO76758.1 Murein DD-endopeptidase MepM and murein hydrolase activator NlpD, contain LysM domain [Actinacidiphila guanduensis]
MAFPRPAERGKHRRPRRIGAGAALAGLAVLGAGGAAAAALTSSGGSGDTAGRSAGLTRTADVSGAPAQAAGAQAKAAPKSAGSTKPAAGASGTRGAEPDAGTSAAVPKPATSGTPKASATAKPKPAGTPKAAKAVKSAKAARTARPATPGTAAVTPEAAPRTSPSPVGTAPSGGTRGTAGPTRTAKPPRPAPSSTGTPAAAPTRASGWTLPVPGAPIGAGYKASGSVWSSGSHTGVDFLVPVGTAVHAVAAGTVVSAGDDGGYGTDVLLRHADGSYTLYGQLSQALVTAGQTVTEGQEIGLSGESGNTTGPNLHFEVRTTPDYGSDIDPLAYLREHGVSI